MLQIAAQGGGPSQTVHFAGPSNDRPPRTGLPIPAPSADLVVVSGHGHFIGIGIGDADLLVAKVDLIVLTYQR